MDKGWSWAILLASFGTLSLIGGNMYGVGIIHSTLLERYGESVSLTSWAGALFTSFVSVGSSMSSVVVDKYSCRTAVVVSGVLSSIGFMATAFAPNIQTAIFTCGIVAGCGMGLGYIASVVVIGFNFKRRREFALGIALSGMGAGVFALAPLMQLARVYYGTAGFFIIQASLSLNLITFGSMFFPSQLEIHAKERNIPSAYTNQSKSSWRNVFKTYCKVLFFKPTILLSISMFFNCVGTYFIFMYLPSYVKTKGFSEMQAAFIVSLTGILSLAGRLLTGVVSNLKLVKDIWIHALTLGILSASSFVYPFISNNFAGHIAFAIMLGVFVGSYYVLTATVNIYFFGVRFMSAAIGIQFLLGGFGSAIGPVCAGILIDDGGAYERSIIFAGVCFLLASILSGVTVIFKPSSHVEDEIQWNEAEQECTNFSDERDTLHHPLHTL